MKDLSITQEYLLCSLKDEKDKVCVIGKLGEEQAYLQSLFDWLHQSKPMKVEKIVREYSLSITDRKLNALVNDIGNSLVGRGCATSGNGSIFGNKLYFIPNTSEVDKVIQKIRAELLENGTISDETVALVSLLEKSNQIKKYFSKYESEQLKARLKEIKESPSNQLAKQMVDYVDSIIACIVVITVTH